MESLPFNLKLYLVTDETKMIETGILIWLSKNVNSIFNCSTQSLVLFAGDTTNAGHEIELK